MTMTMSRQQRRASQKRLAKAKDVKAAIELLDTNAEKFAKAAFEQFKAEEVPKVEGAAITKMLLWNMAYLRLNCGYGKKRMLQYVSGLAEFCNDMEFDHVTASDLMDLLDEELGIDTRHELETLKRRAKQSMQDRIDRTRS